MRIVAEHVGREPERIQLPQEQIGPAKGIIIGLALSAVLWAVIIWAL